MSKVRVVEIPEEVKEVYDTDPELARLRRELRSAGGKLGALTKQYRCQVQPLRVKIEELQEQLREWKVVLVRIHGWAFPSLEELNQRAGCRLHPEAEVGWNPDEMLVLEQEGRLVKGKLIELKRYELLCSRCHLVRTLPPDNTAYDCPNCGIVRGSPQKFHEAGERVFDASYDDYHCCLCGEELGYVVYPGMCYP